MTSIALSLDSMLSSMYGTLTAVGGYDDTATATSTSSATSTATAPPDLPTSLSDFQFVILLRRPNADDVYCWMWAGYLLPTYYDEEYVCNSAYEVVSSTDHTPDLFDEDTDYRYPIYLNPFDAQDLRCGYVSQGLTPGDLYCDTNQVLPCLELDALHAVGSPGYTCREMEFYLQAWCPMAE